MERVPVDREIVTRFVDHLRDEGRSGLKVDCWPEDENPGQSEIEAIAGDLAIEHTSVDTLPQQRRIAPSWRSQNAFYRGHQTCGYRRR